ncbi:glycosyltransferase [Paenibacillus sp. DMB5]|uniref:glycosyltransferase n=1 Tax=Paenibacillus sp. DMB5 TaxID=1780103 RepID=UPI000AE2CDE0|nr:glycosyltransferase [Paenibacillus sp. DMB5]
MYLKLVETVEKNFDIYILFTESMKKIVNVKNKPYLVMEGIFNNEFDLAPSTKNKAIMHAGTLSHEYGVGNIIEAFLKIQDDNLELWLFGDGNMREAIEVASSVDSRIHYFGFKPQKEVFEYEKKAMLLINVRNPRDLYTKYSFPSKTFEYMVSGTPFLTTKLEGIPSEYYNYIYTIESNEVDLVKEKILGVLGKSQRELDEFGENARNYVLNNKNTNMQLAKVVKLLKNNM